MVGATLLERRSQTLVRRTVAAGLAAALLFTIFLGIFATWRKHSYDNAVTQLQNKIGPLESRLQSWDRLTNPDAQIGRLAKLENQAADRTVWLTLLEKVARMLPENGKMTTPEDQKVWLIRLSLKAKANEPGAYEGEIEAGTRWRTDGSHNRYIENCLRTPLAGDKNGMFRNVNTEVARASSALSMAGSGNDHVYWVVRMKFDVVPGSAGQ